jgi:hypothetical protein
MSFRSPETFKPALGLLGVRQPGPEANHLTAKSVFCRFCILTQFLQYTVDSLHSPGKPLVACSWLCDHVVVQDTSTITVVTTPGKPLVSCNLMCDHVTIQGTNTITVVTTPGKPLVSYKLMCDHVAVQGTN